jgi:hypothetical protein
VFGYRGMDTGSHRCDHASGRTSSLNRVTLQGPTWRVFSFIMFTVRPTVTTTVPVTVAAHRENSRQYLRFRHRPRAFTSPTPCLLADPHRNHRARAARPRG